VPALLLDVGDLLVDAEEEARDHTAGIYGNRDRAGGCQQRREERRRAGARGGRVGARRRRRGFPGAGLVEGVDPLLQPFHLFVIGGHPFVEVGRAGDGRELVGEDRFQAALAGGDRVDDSDLTAIEAGAFLQGTQRLGEAALDPGQVDQIGGVGVAAVGICDAALVGDVGADLLGEELGLTLGERPAVGVARVGVAD